VPPTEVAAIFLEPVQGEGGYIVPPASWIQRLRSLLGVTDVTFKRGQQRLAIIDQPLKG
jgi:4-aminobutyrate aminotransferase-like enzyme